MLTCPHCGEGWPAPPNLTARQLEVYEFIADYIAEHGYAPSYDEIMVGTDMSSKSHVNRLLTCLQERGAIRRIPYMARGIELVA